MEPRSRLITAKYYGHTTPHAVELSGADGSASSWLESVWLGFKTFEVFHYSGSLWWIEKPINRCFGWSPDTPAAAEGVQTILERLGSSLAGFETKL